MILESEIEKKVCDYAKRLKFRQLKLSYVGRRSAPDRLFSKLGVVSFYIEFKAPGKHLRFNQKLEYDRLWQDGSPVYVIDNVEDGIKLIDEIDEYLNVGPTLDQMFAFLCTLKNNTGIRKNVES